MNRFQQLNAIWDRYAPAVRRVVVLGMFLGIPLYVWWVAAGMMPGLEMDPGIRFMLGSAVFATVVFGGMSAFLVWRDLDLEP